MNRNQRLTTTLVIGLVALAAVLIAIFALDNDTAEDDPFATEEGAEAPPEPLFPEEGFDEVVVHFSVTDHEDGTVIAASLASDSITWNIDEAPEGSDTGLGIDGGAIRHRGSSELHYDHLRRLRLNSACLEHASAPHSGLPRRPRRGRCCGPARQSGSAAPGRDGRGRR